MHRFLIEDHLNSLYLFSLLLTHLPPQSIHASIPHRGTFNFFILFLRIINPPPTAINLCIDWRIIYFFIFSYY